MNIMKKNNKIFTVFYVFLAVICVGCASGNIEQSDNDEYTGSESEDAVNIDDNITDTLNFRADTDMESNQEVSDNVIRIHNFEQEEVAVISEVQEYDFDTAVQIGEVQELIGMLPGASPGTWYIITIDGVEYYYGRLDEMPSYYEGAEELWIEYELYGWSIIDDSYELANGLKVGMTEREVMEQYSDMAVIDFDNCSIYDTSQSFMLFNKYVYPQSHVGDDSNFDYSGEEYYYWWSDKCDYVISAYVDLYNETMPPKCIGLLIKDHMIVAITFCHPTAG